MLYGLQHLDEKVGIISRDSLLLWSSPHSVNTFRLVLVGHCWSWLCLRGHHIHVSRCLWSQRHNLRGLYLPSLSFSQLPSEVANLNVINLFCILGWTTPTVLWANGSVIGESRLTQLKLSLSQLMCKLRPLVRIFVTCPQQEILSQKTLWQEKHNTAR